MMEIFYEKRKKSVPHADKTNESFLDGRIGFWGNVKDVDSTLNCVGVVSDTGNYYPSIPVISEEWVYYNKDLDYVPSSRNLPPIDARVFVLMPTRTITGAFVLCSGYAGGESCTRALFSDKNDKNKNNAIKERISQGGWKTKEYYADGNRIIQSNDGNIEIHLNLTDNDDDNLEKEVLIKAWNNTIKINNDGIEVKDKNNNKVVSKNSGLEITDKNENIIKMKQNVLNMKVKNGSEIQMDATTVNINNHLVVTK